MTGPWVYTCTHTDGGAGVELRLRLDAGRHRAALALRWAAAAAFGSALAALVPGASLSPGVALALRCCLFVLGVRLARAAVVEESVLVLRGVGVQRCIVDAAGGRRTTFVPAADVAAVVVNEGITRCDVRYYLALVVMGRPRLELLFEEPRPGLPVVADAYRAIHRAVHGSDAAGQRDVPMYASSSTGVG